VKSFINSEFLLTTDASRTLFHGYAEKQPILDYHSHISPQDIAEDRHFENIAQLWLEGDHYKWRQMRANGVPEGSITGAAPAWEKFLAWAGTLERAMGNPLYHWSHLELRRYFGYEGVLNRASAKEVWEHCNNRLRDPAFSARNIIASSRVALLCTTDDPIDSLCWHAQLRQAQSFGTQVLPSWRPDKAIHIENPAFVDYLVQLGKVSGVCIDSFAALQESFKRRLDYFLSMGCRAADHGLTHMVFLPVSRTEVERIFAKRLRGEPLSADETAQYQTAFLRFAAQQYRDREMVMEIHYGCLRNNNTRMFEKLGPDTGFDCINNQTDGPKMAAFLDAVNADGGLPRMLLFSLNPQENAFIGALAGCFQNGAPLGRVQQGAAWWFNDHKTGMKEQLISFANLGLLGNFVGMLTDSRSLLSYSRHEYFRRILCDLIGGWVENGELPSDLEAIGKMLGDICHDNAVAFFGFSV